MCQAVYTSTKSIWTTRVSRLLIVAGLTLLVVQNSQSMPSREFRQFSASSEVQDRNPKYEYGEYGEVEDRRYLTDVKTERIDAPRIDLPEREFGSSTTVRTTTYKGAIKYPGDWESKHPNFAAQPLPDCKGKTFCEGTATAYPQEYMSNLIRKTESLKLFSAVDKIDFSQRVGFSDGGAILCTSEEQIVYPTTAKNREDKWLFILQDEKQGYSQGVKVENCNTGTAEGSCNIIEGSIFGYKTSCKQKYVFRILAAVHENGTAVTEDFSMPSSCCCQLKRTGEGIGTRIGGNMTPKQSPALVKGAH